jgi:hypothetical protein
MNQDKQAEGQTRLELPFFILIALAGTRGWLVLNLHS